MLGENYLSWRRSGLVARIRLQTIGLNINTLSAKIQFWFFCVLYYGAIAFGVVFFRNFDSDVIVAYTNLETILFFSLRCVTTGGSRGTQVKR